MDPTDRRAEGDFYDPPSPLPSAEPGHVIWVEPQAAPEGAAAWKVLYVSTGIDGAPIAVSGWVAVPEVAGPHRVLAVAHGTTGLGDSCAPTRRGGTNPFRYSEYLAAGFTVAYTDYQGLGTPGLHHYLVAEAEARAVLDVVRAAREIDPDATTDTALYGFSQGGHAVMAAAQRAQDLAPELTISHTAVLAPAVFIREWVAEAEPAQIGYLVMIARAYADAYGEPLEDWLGPPAIERLSSIDDGCFFDIQQAVGGLGRDALIVDATEGSRQGDILDANDPGLSSVPGSVLLVTGGADDLFTEEIAHRLIGQLCAGGAGLDLIHYGEATHAALFGAARDDALEWFQGDREHVSSGC